MLNTYPCNPFPISSEQLHKGDNEDLQAQINAIKDGSVIDSFGDVETALDTKADNDVIAPEFDAEAGTYEIGDLVMNEGKLYEFTSAHETAGEWDPTEVTETTVADELSSLESGLTNLAGLHFLPVTFIDTFKANSNITNGVTVSDLTGGVLTSDSQIKGIIIHNGYPYFLYQLQYQGKIIMGTDSPRSQQETISLKIVILY